MVLEAIQEWRHPLLGGGEGNDDVGEAVKKIVIGLLYLLFSTGDEKVDLFLQKKKHTNVNILFIVFWTTWRMRRGRWVGCKKMTKDDVGAIGVNKVGFSG